MPVSILVATPHTAFGELLRISLEDSKQYQVQLVFSGQEARAYWSKTTYQLAILDADLHDEPFVPLCYDLLDQQKGIRLVIIPPENNPNHPALGGLIPHGYLNRPFYLPDLLETVSRLISQHEVEPKHAKMPLSYTVPPWLQEPLTLQSYLEKEITRTQALAGFVGINGPQPGEGDLRASTGRLNEAAAKELAGIVFRYWNRDEKTDLMRFMRLSANKTDYLVYATQISGEMVLITVYDTSTPLSQIRPQTRSIAQTLAALPPEGYKTSAATFKPGQPAGKTGETPWPPSGNRAADEPETQPFDDLRFNGRLNVPDPKQFSSPSEELPASTGTTAESDRARRGNTEPTTPRPEGTDRIGVGRESASQEPPLSTGAADEVDAEDEEALINLTALLGNIPAPDPHQEGTSEPPLAAGWDYSLASNWPADPSNEPPERWKADEERGPGNASGTPAQPAAKGEITEPADPRKAQQLKADSAEAAKAAAEAETEARAGVRPETQETAAEPPAKQGTKTSLPVEYSLPVSAVSGSQPKPDTPTAVSEPERSSVHLDDTHPRVISAITNIGQLEPISPAISLLNYTCVLVPRLPQHFLVGELADQLSSWVQQLCLAFGWRLEGIAIRPDYLQWTVQVAPSISPGNLVRIVRQRTSQQIFARFEHLVEQNPSGDFWAIGYLIVSGTQPPSAQLLRDYIAQTRKRQGIGK